MFSSLRGIFQRFAVSAEVIKANRRLLVYPVVITGGSVAAATKYYSSWSWKGIYNDFTEKTDVEQEKKEEEDEDYIKYKAWKRKMMMKLYNKVYKVERDNPNLFTTAYDGKSIYEILHEDDDDDDDDEDDD